jgi:hypothetical protein
VFKLLIEIRFEGLELFNMLFVNRAISSIMNSELFLVIVKLGLQFLVFFQKSSHLGGMVSVEFAKSKLDIILAKNLGCL